jgi:hypothetical protein
LYYPWSSSLSCWNGSGHDSHAWLCRGGDGKRHHRHCQRGRQRARKLPTPWISIFPPRASLHLIDTTNISPMTSASCRVRWHRSAHSPDRPALVTEPSPPALLLSVEQALPGGFRYTRPAQIRSASIGYFLSSGYYSSSKYVSTIIFSGSLATQPGRSRHGAEDADLWHACSSSRAETTGAGGSAARSLQLGMVFAAC